MITSPFNTSASNVGNAAMAGANIPWDAPIEMKLGADGPGESGAYVEISSRRGYLQRIPIDAGRLAQCRQEDDGPAALALVQRLVDDLAAQIRTAVDEALA